LGSAWLGSGQVSAFAKQIREADFTSKTAQFNQNSEPKNDEADPDGQKAPKVPAENPR